MVLWCRRQHRVIDTSREPLIKVYLRRAAQAITAFGAHQNMRIPVGTPDRLSWTRRPHHRGPDWASPPKYLLNQSFPR